MKGAWFEIDAFCTSEAGFTCTGFISSADKTVDHMKRKQQNNTEKLDII